MKLSEKQIEQIARECYLQDREYVKQPEHRGYYKKIETLLNGMKLKRELREANKTTISLREQLRNNIKKSQLDFALKLAQSYHSRIKPLYISTRADINVGYGATDEVDWGAYSKSYKYPARWRNAGVYIEDYKTAVVENYRGNIVLEFDIPKTKEDREKYLFSHPCLIEGDLYCKRIRNNVFARYNHKNKFNGFAIRLRIGEKFYYEHGETIRIIKQEYRHKLEIANKQKQQKEINAKLIRATQLALRLVKNIKIDYQTARKFGFCEAGIKNFCRYHNFDVAGYVTPQQLLNTKNPNAINLVHSVITNIVRERLLQS